SRVVLVHDCSLVPCLGGVETFLNVPHSVVRLPVSPARLPFRLVPHAVIVQHPAEHHRPVPVRSPSQVNRTHTRVPRRVHKVKPLSHCYSQLSRCSQSLSSQPVRTRPGYPQSPADSPASLPTSRTSVPRLRGTLPASSHPRAATPRTPCRPCMRSRQALPVPATDRCSRSS